VDSYVSIAFPFNMFKNFADEFIIELNKNPKPILSIIGTRDDFTPINVFREWMDKIQGSVSTRVINNTDHFFLKQEYLLGEEILKFLNSIA
ncbi:MAG: hypothetical protein ACTSVI_15655, partial [Promethearchaeota archaeon]